MALSTKVSGTWKEVNGVYTRVGGSWKTVSNIHTRVNGVWKEVYALAGGNDEYTVLLLHGDGVDGSTTIIDSSTSGKTVTPDGNAQIDTAQSKFGGASIYFDGANSYLWTADSTDWYFGTGDWTIDFWFRMDDLPGVGAYYSILQQWKIGDGTNRWVLSVKNASGNLEWTYVNEDDNVNTIDVRNTQTSPSADTWYHFAITRASNVHRMFIDGTQIGTSVTDATAHANRTASLYIGCAPDKTSDYKGWIDELRISKGIARWTADFTPPAKAYS